MYNNQRTETSYSSKSSNERIRVARWYSCVHVNHYETPTSINYTTLSSTDIYTENPRGGIEARNFSYRITQLYDYIINVKCLIKWQGAFIGYGLTGDISERVARFRFPINSGLEFVSVETETISERINNVSSSVPQTGR